MAKLFRRSFGRPPRRAYPTRAGLFALGSPIILGIAAVNAGNNLLFMLLGGVLGAIVLSGILSERNLRGVDVDVRPVSPAYAGEPARLNVTFTRSRLKNPGLAYGLRVVERRTRSLWASLPGRVVPGLLDVTLTMLEGVTGSRLGSRTFEKRGPAKLGPCELVTRYPFGLLEKLRDVDVGVEVLVRPKRVPVPKELADPRGLASDGDESSRRGIGLDVYGLREREERDAMHRLHALRSLTLGRDVVIETAGIERPIAWLGVANTEGADPEAFERALEVAQAVLESWEQRGFAVGLVTAARRHEPGASTASALSDVLAQLALEKPAERPRSDRALWIVPRGARALDASAMSARIGPAGEVELVRAREAA